MNPFGELSMVDLIVCGGVVVAVIVILGAMCWSADQTVSHDHRIVHTGQSRRRACQREKVG